MRRVLSVLALAFMWTSAVVLIALAVVLAPLALWHPLFGWTDHPGWAARYERWGRPWWAPRPSWHALYKLELARAGGPRLQRQTAQSE